MPATLTSKGQLTLPKEIRERPGARAVSQRANDDAIESTAAELNPRAGRRARR